MGDCKYNKKLSCRRQTAGRSVSYRNIAVYITNKSANVTLKHMHSIHALHIGFPSTARFLELASNVD